MTRHTCFSHIAFMLFGLACAPGISTAQDTAQSYPARPIKLIVGGAPGSVPDMLSRPFAEKLSSGLGQPVIVENRPGAGGNIAMDALVKSRADGYAIALATMSQAVFNTYLFAQMPYEPRRDLEPIGLLVTGAMALAAHPSFPAMSMQELVRLAKARPGQLFVAVPQAGSPPHVVALLLARAAGIDLAMVPHKSGSDAIATTLSGQAPLILDAPTILSSHVKAGKLKALVVTGSEREAVMPDVPTAIESGLADVQGEAWIGLVAPRGTSREIVGRLNREIGSALGAADMQALLAKFSFRRIASSPEHFAERIRDDHVKWSAIIRDAGLRVE